MRILVQWTRANPRGWEESDSAQWRALSKRSDPTGMGPDGLDDEPGWIFAVNVQGVDFLADHYAIEPLPQRACRVTIWNDDPAYYTPDLFNAAVWTFSALAPDPGLGGRWNTRQTVQRYAGATVLERMVSCGIPRESIRPYTDFAHPDEAIIRHGKLVTDELNVRHNTLRTTHGWREWTEGVPARHVASGQLRHGARG